MVNVKGEILHPSQQPQTNKRQRRYPDRNTNNGPRNHRFTRVFDADDLEDCADEAEEGEGY